MERIAVLTARRPRRRRAGASARRGSPTRVLAVRDVTPERPREPSPTLRRPPRGCRSFWRSGPDRRSAGRSRSGSARSPATRTTAGRSWSSSTGRPARVVARAAGQGPRVVGQARRAATSRSCSGRSWRRGTRGGPARRGARRERRRRAARRVRARALGRCARPGARTGAAACAADPGDEPGPRLRPARRRRARAGHDG